MLSKIIPFIKFSAGKPRSVFRIMALKLRFIYYLRVSLMYQYNFLLLCHK